LSSALIGRSASRLVLAAPATVPGEKADRGGGVLAPRREVRGGSHGFELPGLVDILGHCEPGRQVVDGLGHCCGAEDLAEHLCLAGELQGEQVDDDGKPDRGTGGECLGTADPGIVTPWR